MKKMIVIFLALTASISAQEYWGEATYIWGDGGGTCYLTEPSFYHETNEILITFEHGSSQDYRILWLNMELFFPESLSIEGFQDISPFLSYDSGTMYFSSNRPGGYGGFDIWKSVKVDDEWTMPVNLGAEINSAEDETGPSLPLNLNEIYFHRGYYSLGGYITGHLYYSEYVSGNWILAQLLPPPVNSSDLEFKPSISSNGNKLYFISTRPNSIVIIEAVWVSYKSQNNWLEPTLLTGQINEIINSGVDCGHFINFSAVIDSLGESIVFNKLGTCLGCPDGRVYISQLTTNITNPIIEIPSELSLSVYPNPFNSSISITTGGISSGSVEIYNLLGQEIREFNIAQFGEIIVWNGKTGQDKECPSGVYFVRLKSENRNISHSITLIQ